MKRLFLIFRWCAVIFVFLFAFSGMATAKAGTMKTRMVKTEKPFTSLVISWDAKEMPEPLMDVRILETAGEKWSEWYQISDDPDRDELDDQHVGTKAETLFMTNESSQFEYRTNLTSISFQPLEYGEKRPLLHLVSSLAIDAPTRIISRDEWGAKEELLYQNSAEKKEDHGNGFEDAEGPAGTSAELDPDIALVVKDNGFGRTLLWPLQFAKKIQFIVIHHTASEKDLDHPEQALQNLFYYHTVKKGWGDIGYNFVIDPQGNIYEGRQGGDKVIGGHARNLNKVSVGIAVMGNYDEGEIPVPVMHSLLSLVNLLSQKYGIDPLGSSVYKEKTYPNVSGHRDSNPTTCPGQFLYQKLFGLRKIIGAAQTTSIPVDFQDTENRGIVLISPQQERTFTLRLKNSSSGIWPSGSELQQNPDTLGSEDFYFSESEKNVLSVAALKNAPVLPGETGIFEGKVTSTLHSNLSVFSLKLAISGEAGPGISLSQNSALLPIFTEGLSTSYEVAERHDPKNQLFTGEEFDAWIDLRNTGNFTWKKIGAGAVTLVAQKPRNRKSAFFSGGNVVATLSQDEIKPGETGRFLFHGKAPAKGGSYRENFVPHVENIQYLEDQDLHFDFSVVVPGELPQHLGPMRVKLSFEKAPIVQVKMPSTLFDAETKIKDFPGNAVYRILPLKNGSFRVTVKNETHLLKGPVRIYPKFIGANFTIMNWRRSPKWNPKINDNQFRGTLEIRQIDGKIVLIDELPLEDYLKGIGEVSNDTPYEKIKAIITLARTYAAFYMTKAVKFPGQPYYLDDDPEHSQKYLGYGFEKRAPNLIKAVKETNRQYVTYQGKLVKTPYFSQSDGRTRSAQEVFGWTDTPYLQSVPDPDCKGPLLGHGVGLSGCGADAQARRGALANDIIKYYYKGVEILSGN